MRSKAGCISPYRVAIVFPADPEQRQKTRLEDSRFARTAAALAEKGIAVEGAPYVADAVEELREQLMRVDGVLVWINPIVEGRDRADLNKVLADVAASGVFVSAHPDVIAKMGTKDVLFRTRTMGWGCDTRYYPTLAAMQSELPESLATGEARVLKRARGHSGDGVWKVELADQAGTRTASVVSPQTGVRVRHAKRGSLETTMSLAAFIAQCEPYFAPDVEPTTLRDFAAASRPSLPADRSGRPASAGDPDRVVRRVAVCGGAGDFLLDAVLAHRCRRLRHQRPAPPSRERVPREGRARRWSTSRTGRPSGRGCRWWRRGCGRHWAIRWRPA